MKTLLNACLETLIATVELVIDLLQFAACFTIAFGALWFLFSATL